MQEADVQKDTVPWLSLVQHHKDVVRRSEEHFFSLDGDGMDSERWSRLDAFEPADLAGPWEIPASQLRSQRFVAATRRGVQAEVFLGGPCVLTTSKGQTVAQPLLYRPVTIDFDADPHTLTPSGGRWALSQLIRRFLERRELFEDPADLLDVLLDAVSRRSPETKCHAALLAALAERIPQLREDLRPAPVPWVIFSPPNGVSSVLQHLYADFQRLDLRLQKFPDQLGGLRLLESGLDPEGSGRDEDLRAFVPLNASQKRAVVGALDTRPVTVVSGPPGCGKSQVVVALMLHAWARGTTVLFASNNNRAVDVVRERLQRIESDFPVVVRAGAAEYNDIDDTLDRVLRMGAGRRLEAQAQTDRIESLKKRRADLQVQLDSGVPERVHQLRVASLGALAEAHRLQEELERREAALREEYPPAGDDWPPELGPNLLERVHSWRRAAARTRRQISEDAERRSALETALADARDRRQSSAAVAGCPIAPTAPCDWLLQMAYTPEYLATSWRSLLDTLGRPLERDLEPVAWDARFDAWSGEAEAREAAALSHALAAELQQALITLGPIVGRIRAADAEVERVERELARWGLGRDSLRASEVFAQWSLAYSGYCSLVSSWSDKLPWTARARATSAMAAAEERLRTLLPVKLWMELGRLDDDGRRRLADVASLVEEYVAVRAAADRVGDERTSIGEKTLALRMRALQIGLTVPSELVSEAWAPLVDDLRRMNKVATAAAKAWEARLRCQSAREEVHARAAAVRACLRSNPFTSAWCEGPGLPLDEALARAEAEPGRPEVERLRLVASTHGCLPLVEAWSEARRAEGEVRSVEAEIAKVPSVDSRLRCWWDERPWTTLWSQVPQAVPADDESFWSPMKELESWAGRWTQWHSVEGPRLRRGMETELETCRQSLGRAFALLPESPIAAPQGHPFEWDLEALGNVFESVTPDRIRGRLAEIDDELEKLEFEEGKAAWLRRIYSDRGALAAVDELRGIYRQGRMLWRKQEEYDRFCERFQSALAAVPVWVTTAQSTQAIPMRPDLFDIVVIDEASQCTLTNLLPLIYRGRRLVVLGDEHQLPAIPSVHELEERDIASRHAVEPWLHRFGHASNNVFATARSVLPGRSADILQLDEHYRSHVQIIAFSNQHIYHRSLRLQANEGRSFGADAGLYMIDTRGRASRFRGSWRNEREADEVARLVSSIRAQSRVPVGVVTPFAGQASLILEKLEKENLAADVVVGTAHKFQGDERPIVIFSTVASRDMPAATVRWIEKPPNLVNVAMTRAQSTLYVVSDFSFCEQIGSDGILGKLARYCRRVEELRRTSPAELELFNWMLVDGLDPDTHVIIGDIEVDFVLKGKAGLKLVVEVDGRQHGRQRGADETRDVFLQSHGYKVMRVTAREALQTPYDVVSDIREVLGGKSVPERYRGPRHE